MNPVFKRYAPAAGIALANGGLALWRPGLARLSASNTGAFLGSVMLIVPPVLVLMALFDAWVPRALVEANMGQKAGVRGTLLALLLGTAAAGPIYAAFPVAVALGWKGATLRHVVTFLGVWSTIKLPMLMLESTFLGLRFALLRLVLTVPGILALAWVMERLMRGREKDLPG